MKLSPFAVLISLNLLLELFLNNITKALAQKLDLEKLKNLKIRSIGPAGMSGRVTAIDAVHSNPNIIYVGTASGGVWKSENGGISWTPIFDEQKVQAIGAIAINQQNPDIIWVGTGEGNPRNSQNSGNGIYKSLDGGKTWQHLGLENSRNIHRIIIHKHNPEVIFVGVQGSAWGDSPERGVFKTTDGGKTWQKILYVNERTGVGEMVVDPSNPDKLIVGMWEFRRQAWTFKSGGAGSGMYVTLDAGKTWTKRTETDGLPSGELGRMGLAFALSNPKIVYALIESKKNALYKSEDGGVKWKKITDQHIGDRPFYYAEIYVDPQNENRIYNLYSSVSVSEDGGKTFKVILPYGGATSIHPDHHAWWIHPQNPHYIIEGNDGGLAISRDRGNTWQHIGNLPLGQFYHIKVDNEIPYNIYGGLQDNGSWRGPAYVWQNGGIRNYHWQELYFGDGFDVVPDQSDKNACYAMSQGGNLARINLTTGNSKSIKPVVEQPNLKLRFNWNAAIAHCPFDKKTIYYGSQFLHKSTNRGDSWQIISPDLTTNNKEKQKQDESGGLTFDVTAAENHCTIISIAPSPLKQEVIWVGTDDGNLQLTQDGGKTWTNVIKNIKGVPENTWIPQIHASHHNAAEAFVVFDDHRRNNWEAYAFRTTDYGKTWTRIADNSQIYGFCLSIIQDLVQPNLLFLGTEFGLYISIDYGKTWTQWKNGFPAVPVTEMQIHPREHDLVIGTFGRAIWVLDDIRPLRQLAQQSDLFSKPIVAFNPPDAYMVEYKEAAGIRFAGNSEFLGQNRPRGAMLTFSIGQIKSKKNTTNSTNTSNTIANNATNPTNTEANKSTPTDTLQVKIEILDKNNQLIRTLQVKPSIGINRIYWNFDQKSVRMPSTAPKPKPDDPEPAMGFVLPGKYKIRYIYGTDRDSTMLNVLLDPRIDISLEAMQSKLNAVKKLQNTVSVITEAMDRLNEIKTNIEFIQKKINEEKEDETSKKLKNQLKAVQDSITKITELVVGKTNVQGILRNAENVNAKVNGTLSSLLGSWDEPTQEQLFLIKHTELFCQKTLERFNQFFSQEYAELLKLWNEIRFDLLKPYAPLEIKN